MVGGRGGERPAGRGGSEGGDSTSITLRATEAVERRRKNEANELRLGVPSPGARGATGFCLRGLNRTSLLKDLGSDILDFSVTVGRAKVDL
jgi:hypothetical protein